MANSIDPDLTAPVWTGFALFAYSIFSDILVFEILGHLLYSKKDFVNVAYLF